MYRHTAMYVQPAREMYLAQDATPHLSIYVPGHEHFHFHLTIVTSSYASFHESNIRGRSYRGVYMYNVNDFSSVRATQMCQKYKGGGY